MAINSVCLKVDDESVAPALQEAVGKLGSADSEVVLDFSAVHRIQPSALGAMEQLLGAAEKQSAKVVLRGVNVDVYKVLKLTKLANRFSFDS